MWPHQSGSPGRGEFFASFRASRSRVCSSRRGPAGHSGNSTRLLVERRQRDFPRYRWQKTLNGVAHHRSKPCRGENLAISISGMGPQRCSHRRDSHAAERVPPRGTLAELPCWAGSVKFARFKGLRGAAPSGAAGRWSTNFLANAVIWSIETSFAAWKATRNWHRHSSLEIEPDRDADSFYREIESQTDFDVNTIVEGRILRVDDEMVLVDVGFKSEGSIPRSEWDDSEESAAGRPD